MGGQRLTTSQFKVVQSAVQAKLADRTGGADEVLPEYVMVVRPRPSSTHLRPSHTRPHLDTAALRRTPTQPPFALPPRASRPALAPAVAPSSRAWQMVQNQKSQAQVAADLEAFLGGTASAFAAWLWQRMDEVRGAPGWGLG